ncbi:MAG: peptidylprolyl isomerase [Verrucomicrobiales bacterium]
MKRFPWRSVLYAALLLYLITDLKFCGGPLRKAIEERRTSVQEAAEENRWVAVVNQEPLTSEQLDLAVFRHLYQRGMTDADIPEANLAMIRRAALQSLIDDTLVRQYADGDAFEAPAKEIDRFVESWESQFETDEELEERSDLQDISAEERRAELARIWTRKRWLEQRVSPGVDVTDAEVREWFEANRTDGDTFSREGFVEPEKIRARHIFLSTVEVDDDTREEMIRDLHRQLVEKESTFEELAEAFSEDPRTKKRGGDLNWFARDRMPEDFAEAAFSLEPGELGEPFRTSLGWHIVEVLDRQPERPVEFEEVENEIRRHLQNRRTADTVKILLEKLRKASNVRLFPEHF